MFFQAALQGPIRNAHTQIYKRQIRNRLLATGLTVNRRTDLPRKGLIDNRPVCRHVKVVRGLWVLEGFGRSDLHFHLLLKLVDKVEEKLLCVVLLVRVELGLKIGCELLDLLLWAVILNELLNELVQLIMQRALLVIGPLHILFLVKVKVQLLHWQQSLHHCDHVTQVQRIH